MAETGGERASENASKPGRRRATAQICEGFGIRADGGLARAHNLGKIAGRWFQLYHRAFSSQNKRRKLYHTLGRANVSLIPSPCTNRFHREWRYALNRRTLPQNVQQARNTQSCISTSRTSEQSPSAGRICHACRRVKPTTPSRAAFTRRPTHAHPRPQAATAQRRHDCDRKAAASVQIHASRGVQSASGFRHGTLQRSRT
jgi:hypothetical protein